MPIQLPNKEPSYVGAVLDDREENGYHDSDFYAVVWDEDESKLKKVVYNSTRYAGGGSCTIDATPDTLEKARNWLTSWAIEFLQNKHTKDSTTPVCGRKVRVVKGRKVPKGTEGILFWMDATPQHYTKIGIATSEEKDGNGQYTDVVWSYLKNVEVVNPEQYLPPTKEMEEEAAQLASSNAWYLPFARYFAF